MKFRILYLLLLLIGFVHITEAQDTIFWNKSGLGAWHNKNNWMPQQIPGDTNVVYIGSDSAAILNGNVGVALEVIVDGSSGPAGLAITAGSSLVIDGSNRRGLRVTGLEGSFLNEGNLEVVSSSSNGIFLTGLYFENASSGTITLRSGIDLVAFFNQGRDVTNNGLIEILGPIAGIETINPFLNRGDIILSPRNQLYYLRIHLLMKVISL